MDALGAKTGQTPWRMNGNHNGHGRDD